MVKTHKIAALAAVKCDIRKKNEKKNKTIECEKKKPISHWQQMFETRRLIMLGKRFASSFWITDHRYIIFGLRCLFFSLDLLCSLHTCSLFLLFFFLIHWCSFIRRTIWDIPFFPFYYSFFFLSSMNLFNMHCTVNIYDLFVVAIVGCW